MTIETPDRLKPELQMDLQRQVRAHSKRLSWLLRHGAGREGISMDNAGWVKLTDVLNFLNLDNDQLCLVIQENNKARFELHGEKLRATQGHSLDRMPVTQEALEASWTIYNPQGEDRIWHATQSQHLDSILKDGIIRGERSHVHLANAIDSPVGKRSNAPLLIEVSVAKLRTEGYEVFISPNGVVLTRFVPPSCIINVRDTRGNRAKVRDKKIHG